MSAATKRSLAHPKAWLGMSRAAMRGQPLDEIVNAGVKARYYGWLSKSPDHPSAEEVRARFPAEWDSYFKFCFVRNPFERVLSEYHWRRQNTGVEVSFLEYLELISDGGDPTGVVPGITDNWVMYTLDNEIAVDFAGRYESLERDFRQVCKRLSIDAPPLATDRKVGRYDRNLAAHYGPMERKLVSILYAREIEAFGYEPPSLPSLVHRALSPWREGGDREGGRKRPSYGRDASAFGS